MNKNGYKIKNKLVKFIFFYRKSNMFNKEICFNEQSLNIYNLKTFLHFSMSIYLTLFPTK